jgi:CheY-like chemotaxis protein
MPRPVSFTRRRSGSILVVDDYAEAREAIREVLEDAGHSVVEARNGQEALQLLTSSADTQVGMIVLDLQMPIMDGWQFLRLLSSYVRLSHIPVLIVSAHPPRLDQVTHPAIVGCLNPPYELEQLLSMVNTYTAPIQPANTA